MRRKGPLQKQTVTVDKQTAQNLAAQIKAPNQYDFNVVATFLCRFHNVSDVSEIKPFRDMIPAYDLTRERTILVPFDTGNAMSAINIRDTNPENQCFKCSIGNTAVSDSKQPTLPIVDRTTGVSIPIDLENVALYNIACRKYIDSVRIPMAVRLNFVHKSMAELQNTEEIDTLFEEAGAVRRAFTILEATTAEGKDMEAVPMSELRFAYQNKAFIKTMSLVTEENLMNGIIHIPHDVCVAAKLPVWRGPPEAPEAVIEKMMASMGLSSPEQKEGLKKQWTNDIMTRYADAPKSETFYAIPVQHVLAWGYHSEEFMMQCNHRAEQFRFIGPDKEAKLLYYLVQSAYFESTLKSFRQRWLNKVDKRPLDAVAFEFLPVLTDKYKDEAITDKTTHVTGRIKVNAYFSYIGAPKLKRGTIKNLAPVLDPHFPPAHEWSVDMVAKTMVMEKRLQEEQRASAPITKKN